MPSEGEASIETSGDKEFCAPSPLPINFAETWADTLALLHLLPGDVVLRLHPVPSCCVAEAEAAGQTAERKQSCASRQQIEPTEAHPAAGPMLPLTLKGRKPSLVMEA